MVKNISTIRDLKLSDIYNGEYTGNILTISTAYLRFVKDIKCQYTIKNNKVTFNIDTAIPNAVFDGLCYFDNYMVNLDKYKGTSLRYKDGIVFKLDGYHNGTKFIKDDSHIYDDWFHSRVMPAIESDIVITTNLSDDIKLYGFENGYTKITMENFIIKFEHAIGSKEFKLDKFISKHGFIITKTQYGIEPLMLDGTYVNNKNFSSYAHNGVTTTCVMMDNTKFWNTLSEKFSLARFYHKGELVARVLLYDNCIAGKFYGTAAGKFNLKTILAKDNIKDTLPSLTLDEERYHEAIKLDNDVYFDLDIIINGKTSCGGYAGELKFS